jgi:hypothetical protein
MKRPHNPIQFREAWDGICALIANPDDTSQVFKIIRALEGNSGERQFEKFLRSENGPTILQRTALSLIACLIANISNLFRQGPLVGSMPSSQFAKKSRQTAS